MLLYNYIDGNAEFGFQSVNMFLENRNFYCFTEFWILVVFFWWLGGKSFENL